MTLWYMTAACCAAPAEIGLRMQHTTRRRDKHEKTPSKAALAQEPLKVPNVSATTPSGEPSCDASKNAEAHRTDEVPSSVRGVDSRAPTRGGVAVQAPVRSTRRGDTV